MKQEQIDRINELYHKSQSVGLTDEEKEEQAALRKQYVADIKASLRGHLNLCRLLLLRRHLLHR